MKDTTTKRTVAFLSVALLMGALVLAGCDNGGDSGSGGGKTVTFTLAKVSATSFTVTVDGGDWNENVGVYVYGVGALFSFSALKCTI